MLSLMPFAVVDPRELWYAMRHAQEAEAFVRRFERRRPSIYAAPPQRSFDCSICCKKTVDTLQNLKRLDDCRLL